MMPKFNGVIDADTFRKSLESSIRLSYEPIMHIKEDGIYIQNTDNDTSPMLLHSIFISKEAFDEYNFEKEMKIQYRGQIFYDNLKRLWGGIVFGSDGQKIQMVQMEGGKKFEMRLIAIDKSKEKDTSEFFKKLESYGADVKFSILTKEFKDALKDALSMFDPKDWKPGDISSDKNGLVLSTEKGDGMNKFEFKVSQKEFEKAKATYPLNQISDAFASIQGDAEAEFQNEHPIKVISEHGGITIKFMIAPVIR